ncbi:phosphatidylinositol 4-phosphate 5-kinase 9-like [Dorcoceras hygrometricum]|uniref:Phosphatidylinositol 4-phosphate 5-kinase 9-like n=1 Tax=Dorcoceras hygrometricum TaxID=472368 RepID=A0A2Z7D188_9LAMI|nr:phosphatidylinositol 4-phosphate 5-kinase 9-like [Dorcoceras hygrometricum]
MTSALMSSQSAVGYQQMKLSARDEATSCWRIRRWISVDDVIGDVITFSRCFERAVARISRCYLEIAIAKRCRLHKLIRQRFALALKIQQEDFALIFQQSKLQWIQSQRKDIQSQEDKSIIVEEDSGESFDEPDTSNSSIQSRAYMNQLLLSHPVVGNSRRKESKKAQSYPVVVMDQQRSS